MADLKARIAKRCAKEFKDGDFINLGIGLPTQVANYLPEGVTVTLHSENGFAGLDAMPEPGEEDVDIINSGGAYVTTVSHVKFFDTATSFGLVRGGHVKATVLGAMDLCAGCPEVIIVMLHTQKGAHKILEKCTLPLTAEKCVSMIITEMGVMEVRPEGIVVTELHPDYSKEDIQAATGCKLIFADDLKVMEEE